MQTQSWRHAAVSLVAAAVTGGALALLVAYAVTPSRHAPRPPTAATAISLADLPENPLVPSLDRAGIALAGLTISVTNGTPIILARYNAIQGCALELRAYRRGAKPPPQDATIRHQWAVAEITYELMAHGMANDRFKLVASASEQQTRPDVDAAAIDRQLRLARALTTSCNL
jgi:hypothetical protein